MAVLLSTAMLAFAEPAPVYDADEMSDSSPPAQQEDILPPPPAPQEEGGLIPTVRHDAGGSTPAGNSITASSVNMDQRLSKMEQQMASLQESSSAAHIESLQTQIQALRDQVEKLTHKLDQLQTEQKANYTELEQRLSQPAASPSTDNQDVTGDEAQPKKPAAKAPSAVKKQETKPAAADVQPNVAEEQQIYQTAYTLIKDKKYNEAVSALQDMLKKYPSGQFAANAHYWLGELYGLLGNHEKSLGEFITVVTTYPSSPRVSDAQLKVGIIFASQSKWTEAKSAFKKVINSYPGTASSRLASEQLKQIKKAGH